MNRIYKVLAFWTAIFSIMFFVGDMHKMALLFLAQTAFFLILSFFKLKERTFYYIFAAYLLAFFSGFTTYTFFIMS